MNLNFGHRVVRNLAVLVLIGPMFLSSPADHSVTAAAQAEADDCTYIIPNEVETVDGTDNYAHVKPGDVLCLPAGTRENIKLKSLNGSEGAPITVRNTGGTVVITGEKFLTGGIGLISSSYIRVTGSGEASKCGALYPPEEQDCGIVIDDTHKGIKVNTEGGVSHIEIDHIAILETSTITETRGIAIHPLEGQLISGYYVHHNYISAATAEGIYVCTEPHDRPFEILGKLENVEVSYNLLEDIGFDAIKIKVAVNDVKVHHNVVYGAGLAGRESHVGGIKLALSVGDYYNNFIVTGCEGIKMGRDLENPGTRYFNNVVVGAQCGGIDVPEAGALVFNNTVVGSEPFGISSTGVGAQVFDNIIAGTNGIATDGKEKNFSNNWVGPVDAAGFVNPAENNYRLLPGSPAIGAGRNEGIYPAFDIDEVTRPVGVRTDLGAYEYPLSFKSFLPFLLTMSKP
jgi:hypothetical protein